ncbi:putative phosphoenolpyruvate synthase [Trichonephila clavipes]|nr:putative phosphoenolpyruvate synthase [Trichonephila clavipes]
MLMCYVKQLDEPIMVNYASNPQNILPRDDEIIENSGGTVGEDLDEGARGESCLSEENSMRLGKLAIKVEKYYEAPCDIEWGILDNEIYILQSRPVTTTAAETEYEMKHEFDVPLQCENEYYTVANIGEILPGATSPLGIELFSKYFSNVLRKQTIEKGLSGNMFKSKYFLAGFFPFLNHMMLTVAELIIRYGFDTPRSKGFMISIFGRILDDPELLEYAKGKIKGDFKESFRSKFMYYRDLFGFDFWYEKVKNKIHNYHLDFLNYNTAKETFSAILKSCSDFDDAGKLQVTCTESSSSWNMYIFSILCKAKGDFHPDVYSDFGRLLTTSSTVESATIPQAMQDVANQIVKDSGSKYFHSMVVQDAEKWLRTSTMVSGYKFRQFLKKHGHRCLKELDVKSITWRMDPKLLVKLLQNLVSANKGEAKEEDCSINKIISQLRVPLNFMSKCLLRVVVPQCHRAVRGREAGKVSSN